MNYLGHLFLAKTVGPQKVEPLMAGAFLGDFVKGKMTGERPSTIETGIRFHRAVDAFVDSHPVQRQSIDRFQPHFRRYGGIICDVVYDHFLANHWSTFSDQDFIQFCEGAYAAILSERPHLGSSATETITRMQQYASLENYRSETYISRSLLHIGQRLKRANPMDQSFAEYLAHQTELEQDFLAFMPSLEVFAEDWLHANAEPQRN
jgi:acyl carrier protein phosphodiesterase